MPFDAELLTKKLLLESDFSLIWHAFMDAALEPEFNGSGPSKDAKVLKKLAGLAESILPQLPVKMHIVSMFLIEAVPGEMYHGPVIVSTGMGNVVYVKSVDTALYTLPTGLSYPADNYYFIRSSAGKLSTLSKKVH